MAELKGQKFAIGLSDEPEHLWVCYTVDGIENEFELTNVCNVLGDMLNSLVTLLTNPSQLWDESNAVGFVWYSESDSYKSGRWGCAQDKDNPDVRILWRG